jgi:thioesterase domain-containing protein
VSTGQLLAWAEVNSTVFNAVELAYAANPTFRILSTGHSFGGAMATIAAFQLRRRDPRYKVDLVNFLYQLYRSNTHSLINREASRLAEF